ncbi:MAG: methylated-DNA--[protein]-cysteine S-methyltransferase [Chloroflexota bacterium]
MPVSHKDSIECVYHARLADTPIGHLWIATCQQGLVSVQFNGSEEESVKRAQKLTGHEPTVDEAKLGPVFQQLNDYFAGSLKKFSLPIYWELLTAFQQKALQHVYAIPFGELTTYNRIAHALGNPKSIRAVGRANATNPIPIIIPCHRVIGSDGKLRGFAGGLETKAFLLRHEGSWLL